MDKPNTTVAQLISGATTIVALVFVGVLALQGKEIPAILGVMLGGGAVGTVTIPLRPGA